jgi:hypothetical protein
MLNINESRKLDKIGKAFVVQRKGKTHTELLSENLKERDHL